MQGWKGDLYVIPQWTRGIRRTLTVVGAAAAAVAVFAAGAQAHVPVLLDSRDVLPWKAPLIIDGTDGVVLYGTLPKAGAVRSAQLRLQDGQTINITYGIPDLAPENGLSTAKLPRVLVVGPHGTVTVLSPQMRESRPNPELDQNYLLLRNYTAPAVSGTYSILVIGAAPSRFLVVTGVESEEFDGILRGSPATDEQLADWYNTAP